jgi:hypothetical protein
LNHGSWARWCLTISWLTGFKNLRLPPEAVDKAVGQGGFRSIRRIRPVPSLSFLSNAPFFVVHSESDWKSFFQDSLAFWTLCAASSSAIAVTCAVRRGPARRLSVSSFARSAAASVSAACAWRTFSTRSNALRCLAGEWARASWMVRWVCSGIVRLFRFSSPLPELATQVCRHPVTRGRERVEG